MDRRFPKSETFDDSRMSTGPRGGRTRQKWTRRRKRGAAQPADEEELRQFFEEALTLQSAGAVFDLDEKSARARLADALWLGSEVLGSDSMSAANSELAAVLEVLVRNSYLPSDASAYAYRTGIRVENILVDLQRAQSQKKMPLLTARFSCACLRAQLPHRLWEVFSFCLPGLLASYKWTLEFVTFASSRRPPCKYEELPRVGGVMFDNYTRQVLYSSQVTVDAHGFQLDMTNWATIRIPRQLASPNFDAMQLCACHAPSTP